MIDNDKKNKIAQARAEEWREELRKAMPAKERVAINRVAMPQLDPDYRITCNEEVNLGFNEDQAHTEATRCLDCANPQCVTGCPVGINIPTFIKNIERGRYDLAIATIKETSTLPAVCGRVCPQEKQCESKCMHTKLKRPAVAIGTLERFAADWERNHAESQPKVAVAPSNGIKVAAIGSGPSSLAFASDMAREGYDVTVFEALHELGGALKYGIPEYRLPNSIVDFEIDRLRHMGVKFVTDCIVGKTITQSDLEAEGFKGIFVGSGAGYQRYLKIPGESLKGVMLSNEYLMRVNLMRAGYGGDTPIERGNTVAVVGGGNTAFDAMHTAKRMGAKRVIQIYRRSEAEMPAHRDEILQAREEGVEFIPLHNPIELLGDENGRVCAMRLQHMRLSAPDETGRKKPIAIEGDVMVLPVDMVIVSIGVLPNTLVPRLFKGIDTNKDNTIIIDSETMLTSAPHIYAGGDIVNGAATVILAMGDGRRAARHMHLQLQNED